MPARAPKSDTRAAKSDTPKRRTTTKQKGRAATIRLGWFAPRNTFRLTCGKAPNKKGEAVAKVWYLGPDEDAAMRAALSLRQQWEALKLTGATVWPAGLDPLAGHLGDRPTSRSRPVAEQDDGPQAVGVSALTLDQAASLYTESVNERAEGGEISKRFAIQVESEIERIVSAMNPTRRLSSVGRKELEKVKAFFLNRPPRLDSDANEVKGSAISYETAKKLVKRTKAWFQWLDEHDDIDWEAPRSFNAVFRLARRRAMTVEERAKAARPLPVYTVPMLKTVLDNCDEQARAWVLLALNCGFYQVDISDLLHSEMTLRGKSPRIERVRGKTGVPGRWLLWPETVKAVRAAMTDPKKELRVFVSPSGRELVDRGDGHDRIGQAFNKLRDQIDKRNEAEPKPLPFSSLRDTGADFVRRGWGQEAAELYLCHVEGARMVGHYTNRPFENLEAATQALREHLAAAL